MYRLIETICLKDGIFRDLQYHDERFNRSRRALFGARDHIHLGSAAGIPADCMQGIFKCRILYSEKIESVEFLPYVPRMVRTLKLVDADVSYPYKYEDRSVLDRLLEVKNPCDEILIVRNGFITETSYTNVIFFDGKRWVTPRTPLLEGTKRKKLLETGFLSEADIKADDLHTYRSVSLINAMLEAGEIVVPISGIVRM